MGKSTVDASAGFGLRDKLAYAAGDFGCNMSFALKGYLTIYWTQFMGIDNYLMASLLLIVQIWDAINDPIIGAMVDADTHKYRRNKFLAYIWFGAIGLTVAGALCYLPFPQGSRYGQEYSVCGRLYDLGCFLHRCKCAVWLDAVSDLG